MRIQASQGHLRPVNNYNKTAITACPHGNPAGSCPECMGGGGGGGGSISKAKPTLKEQGLLTWADLMPFWYAMLAAKQRQEDTVLFNKLLDKKNQDFSQKLVTLIVNIVNSKVVSTISSNIAKLLTPVNKAINTFIEKMESVLNSFKTFILNQSLKLDLIMQKVKILTEQLKQSLLNVVEAFITSLKEKEQIVKEFISELAKKIKKKFASIFIFSDINTEKSADITDKLMQGES